MTVTEAQFSFVDCEPVADEFLSAVLDGLDQPQKTLPCKFLYDERGARLFDQICRLPEYYPTRAEHAILKERGTEIAALAGPGAVVVEFGSGSGLKTKALLDALDEPAAYVAIDIERTALLAATCAMARERAGLEVVAVCADYGNGMSALPIDDALDGRRLGLFLGSTIGNFEQGEAIEFLRHAGALLGEGGALLIGADLWKERAVLEAAYDDAQGVTADFNLNLLRRINRELGGNFDLDAFSHEARCVDETQRIEMHLVSEKDQQAVVAGNRFGFARGETIHTECSHKYTVEGFRALAEEGGFAPREAWLDRDGRFSLHFLEVV
jgi:dimethylhistidine N-methyltransferase